MENNATALMCEHISIGNPIGASELCEKYGYAVDETNPQQIAYTLTGIIEENPNQSTFKDVCNIHPDKELILELFQTKDKTVRLNYSGGCSGCKSNAMMTNYNRYPIWNATGDGSGESKSSMFSSLVSMQTNTILIMGVVIIGAAILLKNKN